MATTTRSTSSPLLLACIAAFSTAVMSTAHADASVGLRAVEAAGPYFPVVVLPPFALQPGFWWGKAPVSPVGPISYALAWRTSGNKSMGPEDSMFVETPKGGPGYQQFIIYPDHLVFCTQFPQLGTLTGVMNMSRTDETTMDYCLFDNDGGCDKFNFGFKLNKEGKLDIVVREDGKDHAVISLENQHKDVDNVPVDQDGRTACEMALTDKTTCWTKKNCPQDLGDVFAPPTPPGPLLATEMH